MANSAATAVRDVNTLYDSARKPLFPRGPGMGLRFLVLLIVAGGLFYADLHGVPQLPPTRQWIAWALQPVTWLSALPRSVGTLGENLKSREILLAENATLKKRQLVLDAKLLRLNALEAENRRIRALLASSTAIRSRVLIAEILTTSQDPYRHQILIDKGALDGVYKGQALVDAYGVLGQVIRVRRNTAIALLITDPDNGVPVEINRTGLHTVALGRGDGQTLSLPFLPRNADVHVGDLLVSSGLGGRFPAGYPVGHVVELRHPAGESFMEAIAQPAAHLSQGREVLLVWNEPQPPKLPKLPISPRLKPAGSAHATGAKAKPHPHPHRGKSGPHK